MTDRTLIRNATAHLNRALGVLECLTPDSLDRVDQEDLRALLHAVRDLAEHPLAEMALDPSPEELAQMFDDAVRP